MINNKGNKILGVKNPSSIGANWETPAVKETTCPKCGKRGLFAKDSKGKAQVKHSRLYQETTYCPLDN